MSEELPVYLVDIELELHPKKEMTENEEGMMRTGLLHLFAGSTSEGYTKVRRVEIRRLWPEAPGQ